MGPIKKRESSVRITLFVVVVALHLLVIWLFTLSRRLGSHEEELVLVPILMLPAPLQPRSPTPASGKPAQHAGSAHAQRAQPNAQDGAESAARQPFDALEIGPSPSNTQSPVPAPDWRTQAEITAQSSAQEIVAAEDDAKRRASALTAPYKPMPGPRVRGPEFGWDLVPKHRFTAIGHGAYVLPVNDSCSFVFIIVVPMFGCALGGPKPTANGDLFKYMHKPVKFGDWDWRVEDP